MEELVVVNQKVFQVSYLPTFCSISSLTRLLFDFSYSGRLIFWLEVTFALNPF
jgi:hypothetical protein